MAIKYYAGNRLTGVSGDTKPTTLPTGSTFLETNTDDLYIWDGDSWNIVASNTGTEILSNKSFSDSLVFDEISAPSNAATDKVRLYAKSGGKLYSKDDSGNEYDLTAGVGSTSTIAGATDTTITSPSDAALFLYDTGTSTWRDATMSGDATINDTGALSVASAVITGQSAETSLQGASDLVLIYDNSASALRKVTVSNLLVGGVSADTLADLNDTTIASVSSAQVLIYDGTDSWDNKTVSGDITINASGATAIGTDKVTGTMIHSNAVDDSSLEQNGTAFRIKASGVTNAMLGGSIDDGKLSTITTGDKVSGSAVQLSGTSALEDSSGLRIKAATAGAGLAISSQVLSVGVDDSSIEINSDALRVKASGITNAMLAGSIVNAKLTNSSITVSDGSNTTAVVLGGTVTFAATANETTVAESSGTVTIGLPDNVTIAGNLIVTGNSTVNGDTVTQNVATVSVEDPLIILANGNNAADAVDIGFYGLYDTSGSQDLYAGLFRDASDSGKWKLFKDNQAAPTTTVNTSGTGYAVGTLVANVEGDITGSAGSATGNAATATALATARTIGGTSFDGTANIAVALATTATTLASARTIGGTSFDGSANIVPATITVADTTDTTSFVALFESATGDLAPKTDAGITYNAGTGVLTATGFAGPLTGNASGTAGSLATGRTIAMTGDVTWTSASFDGSGNVTGIAAIASDVIINADVKSDAAIAYSKLAALADGNILVGNGSNVATSVNPSGDVDISNAGVFSIASGVIVDADITAGTITDAKLATISTANKVSIAALDIDGASEIGAAIVDADVFIIDDGAGGTNRKVLASRVKTYATEDQASESFAIAMAVAL